MEDVKNIQVFQVFELGKTCCLLHLSILKLSQIAGESLIWAVSTAMAVHFTHFYG